MTVSCLFSKCTTGCIGHKSSQPRVPNFITIAQAANTTVRKAPDYHRPIVGWSREVWFND